MTEREYAKRFHSALPLILGKLMDCLVCGLQRYDDIKLSALSRMADFEVFITATEPEIGIAEGMFQKAYIENQQATSSIALNTPLVAAIELLVTYEDFEGSASECLTRLEGHVGRDITKSYEWPKTATVLSSTLKRIAPNLRSLGIEVQFPQRTSSKRLIRITKKREGESDDAP
jgi:hypothetical protein